MSDDNRSKKRKPKKGCIYILKFEDMFKIGFTSSDPKKRLYYWRSKLKVDFKIWIISEDVADGFAVEMNLIRFLWGYHCYIRKWNGERHSELFFEADNHIREFMQIEDIDYIIMED